jgi:hypothetical protein
VLSNPFVEKEVSTKRFAFVGAVFIHIPHSTTLICIKITCEILTKPTFDRIELTNADRPGTVCFGKAENDFPEIMARVFRCPGQETTFRTDVPEGANIDSLPAKRSEVFDCNEITQRSLVCDSVTEAQINAHVIEKVGREPGPLSSARVELSQDRGDRRHYDLDGTNRNVSPAAHKR